MKIVKVKKKVTYNRETNSLEFNTVEAGEEIEELVKDLGEVESTEIISLSTQIAQDNTKDLELTKATLKLKDGDKPTGIVIEKRLVE